MRKVLTVICSALIWSLIEAKFISIYLNIVSIIYTIVYNRNTEMRVVSPEMKGLCTFLLFKLHVYKFSAHSAA